VVGFTTGSRGEVAGKKENSVTRDDDDNNNNNKNNTYFCFCFSDGEGKT
jgi:hypothetical protein